MVVARSWLGPVALVACTLLGCVHGAHDEPHTESAHEAHWAYDGETGPAAWGALAPAFRTCATGQQQSPIDLDGTHAEVGTLPPLAFHYGPADVVERNNGHTIQDQLAAGPVETVELAGVRYRLEQFHFHHPSEHTVDGAHVPLEIHLVHRSPTGALLVVAVLVTEGVAHPALGALFAQLPGEHAATHLAIDPASLLPAERAYATYAGSLTTPPCTEGVTWAVLTTPIAASAEQLARFAAVFPHNNRPVMPANGRRVRASR